MQIKSAEFVKGIVGTDPILNDLRPQIGFVGRSNVGKSSLINSLCNRKALVKVSTTPGKTKRINFFLINDAYYFVDLPGYGYATASRDEQEKLRQWIVWYIQTEEVQHKKIALILDIKVGVTAFDLEVVTMLRDSNTPCIIVANKSDTVKNSELTASIKKIKDELPIGQSSEIIVYSSKKNTGRDALTSLLFAK
ncbi:MAG: ribosome biogenesis GTP-binding protein YihA/YsxC [bacterium]|nr:ribosome biogenesis GTP-binding protein YihA/YsxC [bacterium]